MGSAAGAIAARVLGQGAGVMIGGRFLSDNMASVHPAVLAAMAEANAPDVAYDGDAWSKLLDGAFSDLFGIDCTALWVSTGTAANSIALATVVQPWEGIICHPEAHVEVDECGAPTFYAGGAKLIHVDGPAAKIDPAALVERIVSIRPDVHQVQPGAVTITNASEYGCVWTPDEVAAVAAVTQKHGLALHMDGARFANAVAFTGAHPGDVTWRAGVDVLSFGFTKNGAMNAEVIVLFGQERNERAADAARRLRKRGGHLLSKGRYIAAQMLAMLDGDLWLDTARSANAGAAKLAQAAGRRLLHPVQANELFLRLSTRDAERLRAVGFEFYDWGTGAGRFVVSWDQPEAEIDALVRTLIAL